MLAKMKDSEAERENPLLGLNEKIRVLANLAGLLHSEKETI